MKVLLEQTTDEDEQAHLYHMLGLIKDDQGEYEEAIEFYEKSLEIEQKTLPPNHPDLATFLKYFGSVYDQYGRVFKSTFVFRKST